MADRALLAITETALERIRGFRASSPELEDAALTVAVTGVAGGEYTVALSLEPLARRRPEDSVGSWTTSSSSCPATASNVSAAPRSTGAMRRRAPAFAC
jgi:hypothetical protein